VQVQIAITGTPAQPTLDQFRNHPGTIATPTGHWQSGPFFRGNPLDSIFRVHSAGVYLDTNSNADWSASAAHTGGALNPVAAPGVATQGVELNVIHPSGEAVPVLSFNVATYNPPAAGATYYTLISFTPSTCAGFSPAPFIPAPIFGMPIDVWGQLFAATPLPPLNGTLDAAGTALGIVTPPIPPPFAGLPIQMRTFVLIGGLPTLFSDHVFRTI
jgi:hypothetical protein